MKHVMIVIAVVLFAAIFAAQGAETQETKLQQLSTLLKKGAAPNVKLSAKEKQETEELLISILPDKDYIGPDKEWKVVYHDMDEGDFFQVDLKKIGDKSSDRFIWFHILYKHEPPKFYGSEDFDGYKGMGMKDTHYFILVGNIEIRAIADSDDYKNDEKIKGILKAFKLKNIEKL